MSVQETKSAHAAPRLHQEGLSADEIQLRAQGHVGELPRQFSPLSTLALAFSITNSWVGYAATFVTPLYAGGGPAVFWAPIIACITSLLITLGLAELASAFPSSGGQYHAAFLVSPPKYRAAIAFTVGWLSCFAWLFTTASANLFLASLCINLATLKNPDYTPTQWQTWFIYVAFIIICTAIVVYLPRWIPRLETFFFWTSLVGFVVNTIVLLAVSPTKQSSDVVFVEWTNLTGWDNGVAMLLAVGQAMYVFPPRIIFSSGHGLALEKTACMAGCSLRQPHPFITTTITKSSEIQGFLCTDSAMHISEELPNPSRYVPRAMWMTILIGIITTIPFTLAFLFSIQDMEAVSLSGLPIMEIYMQALRGNSDGALFFTFWILFIYFGATIGLVVTSGRLLWAFSRDNGLPFSHIFAKTHPTRLVPANATFLTAIFCILYGLIYIGSTLAFNSFVATAIVKLNPPLRLPGTPRASLATSTQRSHPHPFPPRKNQEDANPLPPSQLSLNLTYTIPQTITLLRGRNTVLPHRQFDLGPILGPFCNAFATAWVALYVVIFCFPIFLPVTVDTMNYVVVVLAGTALWVAVTWWLPTAWGGKRNVFVGPDVGVGREGLQLLSAVNAGEVVASALGDAMPGGLGGAGKGEAADVGVMREKGAR